MSEPPRRPRRPLLRHAVLAVAVLVLFGLVAWGLSLIAAQSQRIDSLEERSQRAEQLSDTRGRQVERLGGTPAASPQPAPSGPPGREGREGKQGRAPTQAEIGAIVADYLRRNPPPRGRPPTMAEILTAVTSYLRENPPPAGPSGAPGEDGRDGRDGVDGRDGEDGEDAPPPSDEQIRAAVEAYMAANPLNCQAGYHFETRTIPTTDGLTEVAVCVRDQEG